MASIGLSSGRQLLVGTVPDLPSAVWTVTKDVQFIAPSLGKGKGGEGYAMAAKSLMKMKPIELGKMDIADIGKLIGLTVLSIATRDYLVKQKIIPNDINM